MHLISLRTFIAEYISRTDIPPEKLREKDVMTFAAASAQRFHNDRQCNHVVTFIPVSNYNAPEPKNFHKIIEIAYCGDILRDAFMRPMYIDQLISYTKENFDGCQVKVSFECPKCYPTPCTCEGVTLNVDDEWSIANAERHYWNNPRYIGAYGLNKPNGTRSFYHSDFHLIRPAQHKFFGADYHVRGCVNLDRRLLGSYPIEYKLENRHIRINAEKGTILLAYLERLTDEMGYPLVPDDVDVFEALFWDVEYKMLYKQRRDRVENYRDKRENYQMAMNAKRLGEDHMKRALEKLDSIPYLEWNRMMKNLNKMVSYRNIDAQANRVLADRFDQFVRR